MISTTSHETAQRAKAIYKSKLQPILEPAQFGRYVSIEPVSGDYFLGETFDDAVNAALEAFPQRITHTLRVGHSASMHLGVLKQ